MHRDAAASGEPAEVIEQLRALLATLQLSPIEIRDESELPMAKPVIEAALLATASPNSASPWSPWQIRGWLLALAQFLPGIGPPIGDVAAEMARRISRAKSRNEPVDVAKFAREIEEIAAEEGWMLRRARWQARVEEERRRLIALLS
jgi:hypothetical protein